jgi:hypothetical protein
MNALFGLERCFGWLLQTTWQAAVIVVIILLAQFLLRNRLSPAWRHGLWFLLVARLLMPMTPGSAISVFNLAKWSRRQVALATFRPLPSSRGRTMRKSNPSLRPRRPSGKFPSQCRPGRLRRDRPSRRPGRRRIR